MTDEGLFAIVLAAGESRRFGSTKQLATIAGGTLVGNALRTAEAACGSRSLLVAGNEWQRVVAACQPQLGFFVINKRFRDGMSTSVRAGVLAIADVADAALLMLADQPRVAATHLDALICAWRDSPDSIVASSYSNTLGPPAIFPRALFPALCALEGDQGAKPVIQSGAAKVVSVSIEEGEVDVDRPEDLVGLD